MITVSDQAAEQHYTTNLGLMRAHEAGHAVIAYLMRWEIHRVYASRYAPEGFTEAVPRSGADDLEHLALAVAGIRGERLFFGYSPEHAYISGDDDRGKIADLSARVGIHDLRPIERYVDDLLREHRDAHSRVEAELRRSWDGITGARAAALIRGAP